MNTEIIFRLITLLLLVGAIGTSMYFRLKADREGGQMKTREGQGLLVVLRLLGLFIFLPLFGYLINPNWVAWARLTLPEWVRWLAALVAFALLPLLYWVFVSLGTNISPTQATRQHHQLVTHGPYRYVRHPLYSLGSLFVIAIMVITSLWWLAGMVIPLVFLLWRTPIEEARLIETFGDEYRAYMQRTGRFLPRLI